MGWVFRTYSCNGGVPRGEPHTFELMQDSTEGAPGFCPTCGTKISGMTRPRPARIAVGGKAITKSVDATYRALEAQGEAAYRRTGNPNMKITDMKDNLREGDVAAIMPNNSVTQFMAQAGQRGVGYGWGGSGNMIAPMTSTPAPVNYTGWTGPGHPVLAAIQGEQGRTHELTRMQNSIAGQINKSEQK